MNGPYKTFCGLNKYQMFCTVCAGVLIMVCYRTAQPYPEFKVPTAQLVQRQTLPAPNFAIEEFLQVGPHWAESSRDTFRPHSDYVQKIDEMIVVIPKPIPTNPGIKKDKSEEGGKLFGQIPQGGTNKPGATTTARIDILDKLQEVARVKAIRQIPPVSDQPDSSETALIILTPTIPPAPMLTESIPELVATANTSAASDPYRLPFRLEGIVKTKEKAPPQVILHDLQSGKRVRRFQGQKYGGVIINKIGPGTVEVEVPSESLQMRYIDTAHRWITM
jgi:hypothetical protein